MPVVKVWGVHPDFRSDKFKDFGQAIVEAIAGIKELELKATDVTVHFPADRMKAWDFSRDVTVEITGLFEKPGRTPEVRQQLAKAVATTVSGWVGLKMMTKCFVQTCRPEDGFWVVPSDH